MKTPFTVEQFLDTFKIYNEAVYPMQLVFYLLSILAIYYVFKPTAQSGIIIGALLSFYWLWMGVVYHLLYFTVINKAAYLFGIVFIIQGILFLMYGVFMPKFSFVFRTDVYGITGLMLVLYAMIIYPLIGLFIGHVYPYSPTLGLPCPTTILTFGLLLLTDRKFPVIFLVIPFLWSIIGFTAAFNFGIWEDTMLLVAGIVSVLLIVIKNKKSSKA